LSAVPCVKHLTNARQNRINNDSCNEYMTQTLGALRSLRLRDRSLEWLRRVIGMDPV
jgi:hypothetical protein